MKYLRKFESHNNYYEEIDVDEISLTSEESKYTLSKGIPSTKEERKIIQDLVEAYNLSLPIDRYLKQHYTLIFDTLVHNNRVQQFLTIDKSSGPTSIFPDGEICDIYKLEDEWFIVIEKQRIHYFKCDQLEGLIQYLKERILQ